MTGEQSNWLRTNPSYRAMSTRAPSGHIYANRKMLHPDGTAEDIVRGRTPRAQVGSFEVGILQSNENLERR